MAQKITIRRVGTIFPALCLVVIVMVCFTVAWLSIAGLPGFVLRKIEQEAAPYGLTLRLGQLKLAPASGLAFKALDVRLSAPLGEETAGITLRKLQVSFSVFELLQGNYLPDNIHLLGMNAVLPTDSPEGKPTLLNDADTHLNLYNRGRGLGITTSANLQGIGIRFSGAFQLPEQDWYTNDAAETEYTVATEPHPIRLDEYLEPIQPWLRQANELIAQQGWKGEDFPRLDVKLRYRNKKPTAEIKAEVPTFQHEGMHFRNASLATRYEDDTLSIDHLNFATENPKTEVSLQGAYDLPNRRLTFNLRSTAAIAQIVEMIDASQKDSLLSRLCADAEKSPTIKLRGQIEFAEDYALNNISLRANVQQRDFSIGSVKADTFELSFLLSDGRFNIDNLSLTLPDGKISISALSGNDRADAQATISIPIDTLHQLAEGIYGHPIPLPDYISPSGRLEAELATLLSVKEFKPGITRLVDLIPSVKEIQKLSIRVDSLRYEDIRITTPELQLNATGITHPSLSSDQLSLGNLCLSLKMGNVEISDDFSATELNATFQLNGVSADCTQWENSLRIAQAKAAAGAENLTAGDSRISNISVSVNNLHDFTCSKRWEEVLVKSNTEARIGQLVYDEQPIATDILLSVDHEQMYEAGLNLTMNIQEKGFNTQLLLNYADIEQDGILEFSLGKTDFPLLPFAPLLQHLDALPTAIELPETLTLSTRGSINVNSGQLGSTQLQLHIPALVRTPQTLVVNRGERIPLEIKLDTDIRSKDDALLYSGKLEVQHRTGVFTADISGDLNRYCNITNGHNTIAVNVIDALIDDEDAHSIMRDFRFDAESKVTVSDIATRVEYDNGIVVNSFCKADIRNTDFLIGAIEDVKDNNGNIIGEQLRKDMGKNPYSRVFHATCDVHVDVRMGQKNPDGSPAAEKMQIVLNNPYLDYDNRPWLKRRNISKGTRSSIIRGESIVFDLDNNGIVLNNLEGKAYPDYAFGMYFAPLQEFMQDIKLQYPVNVTTKRCEFPISKRSQVPISGLIRAESATGAAFNFLGTTIPLERFSGFVNLSDDFVFLDKMNARTWGGVLDGAIKIGISGKSTSFDGQMSANNLDLSLIGKAYNTELSPALCNAHIRFQSPTSEVKDVKAYGSATIRDGNLMELGIFQPVGSLISDLPGQLAALQRKVIGKEPTPIEEDKPGMISRFLSAFTDTTDSAISKVDASSRHIPFANHFMSYNIQNASLKFDILNGYLYTRDMHASGYNLDVDMNLRLNLDTLDIRGNLWPQISSVPTLIIAPITFLSDFLIDIVIYGNIEDIQWKFTLDRIMRKGKKKPKASVTAAEEKTPQ